MTLKFTLKIRFLSMSRLCVITQQRSLTLITWDDKSLKIVIHQQRKSGNGAQKEIYGSQLRTYQVVIMGKREVEDATEQQLNLVVLKNIIKTFCTSDQNNLPAELTSSHQNLFHGIQNQRCGPDAFSVVWKRYTFRWFLLVILGRYCQKCSA